ncbi:Rha family transcriptional regulator [Clostridioides difficile]
MKDLKIVKVNNKLTTDSRDTALMVEKEHKILLRDIRNYINQMEEANKNMSTDLYPSDYFIENTYLDDYKREKPCYAITKIGCDFIANKMTGIKGTVFTGMYTKKFDEMEKYLKENKRSKDSKDESEIKYMNAQARLKNARAREAKIYLELADKVDIKEYKQIMYSKTTELISGETLIPLPKMDKKTYSATEIGKMLGISANKVGGLANAYNLKTDEYGVKVWDKAKYSDKQVPNFRYYESVIPVLEKALNAFEN